MRPTDKTRNQDLACSRGDHSTLYLCYTKCHGIRSRIKGPCVRRIPAAEKRRGARRPTRACCRLSSINCSISISLASDAVLRAADRKSIV